MWVGNAALLNDPCTDEMAGGWFARFLSLKACLGMSAAMPGGSRVLSGTRKFHAVGVTVQARTDMHSNEICTAPS